MYKLFLVEDEIVVREGIRDSIPWHDTEFFFCGEASDGELALPLIEETKPDILITDIKMPFMDGLELSRYLRKKMPQIKIIMISGHEDFSFAKEAISIGIEEYVLKPVDANQLLETLRKVSKVIELEKEQLEYIDITDRYRMENEALITEKVMNEILLETIPPHLAASELKSVGIDIYAKYYGVVSIWNQIDEKWNVHKNKSLHELIDRLIQGKNQMIKMNHSFREVVLVVKGNTPESVIEDCQIFRQLLQDDLESSCCGNVQIRIGSVQNRLKGIAQSYREIRQLETPEVEMKQYEEILANELRNMSDDQSKYAKCNDEEILQALLCEGEAEILRIIDQYFENIKNIQITPVWSIYLAIRIHLIYGLFLQKIGEDDQEMSFHNCMIEETAVKLDSHEKLKDYVKEICLSALAIRNACKKRNHHELVESAKQYIKECYEDSNLSLRSAASHIYISDCHLSNVFSKETGLTFVQYLTDIRIGKAKELLATTNMKTGDVGLQVGYKDPHYFSFIFKKHVGCNPSQYRQIVST
jgi:two-component system, response regulator YesN